MKEILAGRESDQLDDLPKDHPARKYKSEWNDLSLINNGESYLVIMNDQRIMVPDSARKTILDFVHIPHDGIRKSSASANRSYFYRGMASDIENMIQDCPICARKQKSIPAQQEVVEDKPEDVLVKMGSDFFEFRNRKYLLLADYLSGYIFVSKEFLRRTPNSQDVIDFYKATFDMFGWPKVIRMDADSRFLSRATRGFMIDNFIKIQVASPGHHQSNGLAESNVGITAVDYEDEQRSCWVELPDGSRFKRNIKNMEIDPEYEYHSEDSEEDEQVVAMMVRNMHMEGPDKECPQHKSILKKACIHPFRLRKRVHFKTEGILSPSSPESGSVAEEPDHAGGGQVVVPARHPLVPPDPPEDDGDVSLPELGIDVRDDHVLQGAVRKQRADQYRKRGKPRRGSVL